MLSMDMFTSEKGSAMADTEQSSETEKESIFVRPTPSSLSSKDPHKWYSTLSTFPGKGSSELIKQASTAGGSRSLPEISESMCAGVRAAKKRSATEESRPCLEELTDDEVMQLTREDCRRYLKERGMIGNTPGHFGGDNKALKRDVTIYSLTHRTGH